ncbi:hypothetical protein [Rhodococcus sp. BH5]|uniref:hypothetical protein n=1 Tax=Rhodococcus sp. BH5 TaxID=2871702 RepID=UPI0022CDBB7E|nr:hypothetical protein [Rhodococcus sp. BH5]MCZ9634703.1 hypothetical protein [Rhodococcus sp. BH5]
MTESRIEKLTRIGQEMAAAVDEMRAEAVDLTPDLTTKLANRQIEGEAAWWRSVGHDRSASRTFDSMTGDSQQAVRTGVERVLAHLQSAGRLIPAGGTALTAEQVEDVRTVVFSKSGSDTYLLTGETVDRLRALFPASEPAEERLARNPEALADLKAYAANPESVAKVSLRGTAPAEPAEEETKAEGPASHCWDMESYAAGSNAGFDEAMRQQSGVDIDDEITEPWSRTEFAVMSEVGDRVFEIDWDRGGTEEALDCIVGGRLVTRDVYYGAWRLVDADLAPSPVVPAPTETGTNPAGLTDKYIVRRVDGSDAEGGRNFGRRYFVLSYDSDPHARAALAAYAASCDTDYPELAADLRARLGENEPVAPTETGPWPTWQEVPEGVKYRETPRRQMFGQWWWVNRNGIRHLADICGEEVATEIVNPVGPFLPVAPFVAAEEG